MADLEDYTLPEFTIQYAWNDVHITKIKLNCSESDLSDYEVVMNDFGSALATAEALMSMVIWHSTLDRVFAIAESKDPIAANLPVIINDRMISFEAFMSELFQSFDGPGDVKIPPAAQKLTLSLAIQDTVHWCPSMNWTKEWKARRKAAKKARKNND